MNKLNNPLDYIVMLLATWFGSGLLPKAPGTWGTLATLPFVWLAMWQFTMPIYAVVTAIVILISMPIAGRAAHLYRTSTSVHNLNPHSERAFNSDSVQKYIKDSDAQEKDPGMIVIDEVAGMAVTMLFVPLSFPALVVGFFAFRFFDIFKLLPANKLEKIGGGAGIVLDDVMAGIYACGSTHLFFYLYELTGLPILP